jgi:predicted lipoprotein
MHPRTLWVALLVTTLACRRVVSVPAGDAPLAGDAGLTRADVLRGFGACAYDLARDFRDRADTLERRTAAFAQAPTSENEAVARAAWEDAIDHWQENEVFQFGPAAPLGVPGGEDLRAQIYAWPVVSRCTIEQGLVGKTYAQPSFANDVSPTARGLYAAEYLLFYPGSDNVCGPTSAINTSGAWTALGPGGLRQRKAEYAHAIALDVAQRARTLEARWSPSGTFARDLATAGSSTSIFASQQLAFNAVSDALFYVEIATKDQKLGKPSGLRDCETETCPDALESPWAKRSKHHVRANLIGARTLAFGCEAGQSLGFDDLLRAMGQGSVADRLAAAFDEAIAAVDAVPDADLDATLARDPQVVRALYVAVKKVTDILRTDFVTLLDLEIPKVIEGDND